MATLPISNTDKIKSQDRQAPTGPQPDNTPVGPQGNTANTGTVTSVSLTMPTEFSVAGSPVTTAGGFTVTKANESANKVWAGPTSGGVSVPSFRSLVTADLPNTVGTVTNVTAGNLAPIYTTTVANSSTAPAITFAANTQSANLVFAGPTTGAAAAPTFRALVTADLPNSVGTGTVTSVGISGPSGVTWANSPVTTAGTFTGTWANEAANTLLSNPTAGNAAPSFNTVTTVLDSAIGNTLGDMAVRGSSVWARLAGQTAAHRQRLMQTGTGAVSALPVWTDSNEVYVSDWASFSAAATQANSLGARLVLDTSVTIAANTTVAACIRVAAGSFTINTGITLTLNGGIEAPLSQIFSGAGVVVLNAATKTAWPEWWGALGGTSSNDDGAGINLALTACGTTTTLSFANKTYYLKNTITINQATPIIAMPGSQIEPASSGAATNGITVGTFNYGGEIWLPNLIFFTGYAIRLQGTNLATINIPSIVGGGTITSNNLSGSAVGLECYFTSGNPVLDNNIFIWNSINLCGSAAIKMNIAGDLGLCQGNYIYCNFLDSNNNGILFSGSGLTGNNCTSNTFVIAGGLESGGLNSCTGINNQSGTEIQLNKFYMMGFFGNGAGGSPTGTAAITGNVASNRNFDGCDFHSEGSWSLNGTYSDIVISEQGTTFGNRFYSTYSVKAPNIGGQGITCPTSPNSRSSFFAPNVSAWVTLTSYSAGQTVQDSGIGYTCILSVSGSSTHPASDPTHWTPGIAYFWSRLPLSMTIPVGGLGPGAFQAFYGYSPYVLGNARLSIMGYGGISQGGFLIEDSGGNVALPTQLFDHTGSNPNEFKIGLRNISSSTIAANTIFNLTITVGI